MNIQTHLVGAQFRPKEIKPVIASLVHGDRCELRREPENEHDSNAIQVFYDGDFIGYIPRGDAEELAPLMDAGTQFTCMCIGSLGTYKPALEISDE